MKLLINLLRRWILNENHYTPQTCAKHEIDWPRAIPFILLNLSCLLVFYVNFSKIAIITGIGLYFIRLFAISAFYHRYFSHKAFQTNRFWQFIFAVIAGTAVQRGPLWWAAHHRKHHMVSDASEDAHSPVQHGFWWSHVGWFLSKKYYNYNPAQVQDLLRYPELVFLERCDIMMPTLLLMALGLAGYLLQIYYPELHTGISEMVIWGFSVSSVVLFNTTVLINSLCHVYGSKRYNTPDNSKNNLLFALLTLGEGWHNNHHQYPVSARQGFMWWEIDITYYIIKLMELIGMVWNVRPVPKSVLSKNLVKVRVTQD